MKFGYLLSSVEIIQEETIGEIPVVFFVTLYEYVFKNDKINLKI